MSLSGNWSNLRAEQGVLVEYALSHKPLILHFEFNPSSITRTRTVTIKTGGAPGTKGGYSFSDESETPRASQGVSMEAESFSLRILLDATDRMNSGDPIASREGVQPEIDLIRTMLEPRSQGGEGAITLAKLGQGNQRAFSRDTFASVLLFQWGKQLLPVFMTQAQIEMKAFLPNLFPYRAETTLTLQIIESDNPIYQIEQKRQFISALGYVDIPRGLSGGING
ncbi:MAG: hypothetical protein JRC86_00315 [Deltaproteobacteria bacterium]|jgi:hypothetical protein|nr:hypothetical protein [Deltaproteobacteria bacterium]